MLVSTSHNFVFIHIAKNGGTTLSAFLRSYAVKTPKRTIWTDAVAAIPFRQAPEKISYPPHKNARWTRKKLGAAFFDNAFTFAFTRNPYDRAVSRYEFVKQNHLHHSHSKFVNLSFADFVSDEIKRNFFISRTQLSEVSDRRGNVIVSKTYKLEEFSNALKDICERINVPVPEHLTTRNTSVRKDYREYFTPEIKATFDKIYHKDLEYFEYEY